MYNMMFHTDLILLHAPSVYDFRKMSVLYGPVSEVIPSTQVFEMYPVGFMTLQAHLQRHGYSVRIINIALKMLRNRRFDAEKLIRKLKPVAFGIDLHWMVHAHGSLALAAIIKKHHPDIGGDTKTFRKVHQAYVDLINWAECPTFLRRRGLPDKWFYDGYTDKWIQPKPYLRKDPYKF